MTSALALIPQHHHLAKALTTPRRDEPQKPSENSITLAPYSTAKALPANPFSQKMASIPHLSCKSSTRPKSPPRMRPGRPLTVICKYHSGHKEDSCRCQHRKEASEAGRPADRFPGKESSPSPILCSSCPKNRLISVSSVPSAARKPYLSIPILSFSQI